MKKETNTTLNKKRLDNSLNECRKKSMSEAIKRGKAYARTKYHNFKTA